jgi:ankyrin repeat protein
MDVVDRLLSVPGVNVNTALTGTGLTPLLYAALHGRLDVVERLLAAPGVDVNLACRVGVTSLGAAITPLAAALVRGHADVAQMLREAGAAKPHG